LTGEVARLGGVTGFAEFDGVTGVEVLVQELESADLVVKQGLDAGTTGSAGPVEDVEVLVGSTVIATLEGQRVRLNGPGDAVIGQAQEALLAARLEG
jgi:hypothetical protein